MKVSSFANVLLPFAIAILVAHGSFFFAAAENVSPRLVVTATAPDQEHPHILVKDTPSSTSRALKKKRDNDKKKKHPKVQKSVKAMLTVSPTKIPKSAKAKVPKSVKEMVTSSPSSQLTVAKVSTSSQPTAQPSSSPQPSSSSQPTNDPQKDALLALKEGLINNDASKLADWVSTTDPCDNAWTGITCNGSSDVTIINVCK